MEKERALAVVGGNEKVKGNLIKWAKTARSLSTLDWLGWTASRMLLYFIINIWFDDSDRKIIIFWGAGERWYEKYPIVVWV